MRRLGLSLGLLAMLLAALTPLPADSSRSPLPSPIATPTPAATAEPWPTIEGTVQPTSVTLLYFKATTHGH